MLIENAFHYLPEILTGSNYAAQGYEAGIVNAISLAVLQELNARNVPNPIAALTVEKLYNENGFERPDASPKKRYLRSDLFVDTSRTFVATAALGRFGWRHRNYVEAKFFRPGGPPSTTAAAVLLGDLIRLCSLTPPVVSSNRHNRLPSPCAGALSADGKYKEICVARYFLHVYEGTPEDRVGKRSRKWLKTLRTPGTGTLEIRVGDDSADTFKNAISPELQDLKLTANIFNQVIEQRTEENVTSYLCVLTRIESFKVSCGNLSWAETNSREGTESSSGDWTKLQALIGKHILFSSSAKSTEEETPPSSDEKEAFDEVGNGGLGAGGEAVVDGGASA